MIRKDIGKLLAENTYPGRGIVIGMAKGGLSALIAYFIMGRSENSRNRIFEAFEGGLRTKAFDESKMVDPSLIIYNAFRTAGDTDIVTNGDQTDTIYEFIRKKPDCDFAFERALFTREFEPDAPNYTPRISGLVRYDKKGGFNYKLSVLKSAGGDPSACDRFFYNYTPVEGRGHFIHTYLKDGNPIPSFSGEPEEVFMPETADEFAGIIWNNLNSENKVSLFVRAVPLNGGKPAEIIINKNK